MLLSPRTTHELRENKVDIDTNGNDVETGAQFTTGGCVADADCQEGCCAGGAEDEEGNAVGICSGIGAEFQNGKTGCGFVDPNAEENIANAEAIVAEQGF